MDGGTFSRDWLALREPVDRRSRSQALAAKVRELVPPGGLVVDLGTGSGANRRYLGSVLPDVRWRLVDRDPALLAAAGEAKDQRLVMDLSSDLEDALAGAHLVTGSAILDLVSRPWLQTLLELTAAPLFFTLTVDGRVALAPPDPYDVAIDEAVLKHQWSVKSFGEALGPAAPGMLRALAEAEGRAVEEADSAWILGPDDELLLEAYLDGRAAAAEEAGIDSADVYEWRAVPRRGAFVGHLDQLIVGRQARSA